MDQTATLSVRYSISGGIVIYLSTTIVKGDDSNKQYDKEIIKTYDSGNFVKDWYNALEYAIKHMKKYNIVFSKGIDDYVHLSNKYKKVYLKKYNNHWTLFNNINDGYVFYVLKDSNLSWEDLKQLCIDEK